MKPYIALAVFFGMLDATHWEQPKGALIVTSTNAFEPNHARNVSQNELVSTFREAFISKHTAPEKRGLSLIVLAPNNWVKLKAVTEDEVKGNPKLKVNDLQIDKDQFLDKLRQSGLNIDLANSQQLPVGEFRSIQELVDAASDSKQKPKRWSLLGKSHVKAKPGAKAPELAADTEGKKAEVVLPHLPGVDRSILIEWGNRDRLEEILKKIKADGTDGSPLAEQNVYDRHFLKLPLQVDLMLSRGDVLSSDSSTPEKTLFPIYAVRSRFNEGSGYLLFVTGGEKSAPSPVDGDKKEAATGKPKRTLQTVALEAPVFKVEKDMIHITVDGQCFLDKFLRPEAGISLTLPAINKDNEALAQSKTSSMKWLSINEMEETKKKRWMINLSFPASHIVDIDGEPVVSTETKDAKVDKTSESPEILLEYEDLAFSYSARFSVGNAGTNALAPISAKTPKVIYDKNCEELVLVDPAAETKPTATK